MKIRFLPEDECIRIFNYNNGTSIRIEKSSNSWRKEGPLLLDISLTNRCYRECSFCYRQSKRVGRDMAIDDYKKVLSQAKECGVQQIAFGGGDPTLHPDFCKIIEMTKKEGIIPNFSTNGDYLDETILECAKRYCGAMAISIYDPLQKYEITIKRILERGIRLNLHFIINSQTITDLISFLDSPPEWIKHINGIIFLNYKPIAGDYNHSIQYVDETILKTFAQRITEFSYCSIGFDSCSVSFINKYLKADPTYFDYCESARMSAFIREDLYMFPCSFYTSLGADLKLSSIKDIWVNDSTFVDHRNKLQAHNSCSTCENYDCCHGGCPIYDINVCDQYVLKKLSTKTGENKQKKRA